MRKNTRVRTSAGAGSSLSATIPSNSGGKSELQRKLQSMVIACRDNTTAANGNSKLSHTELRIRRAEAAQVNFAKTSPAAMSSLPIESPRGAQKSSLDPLQNCYGRPSMTNSQSNGPKGILSKPSTPKMSAKGKRVTWNLDLESDIPSRPDSPYNPEPIKTASASLNSSLPTVEPKSPMFAQKKPSLFQPKPARPSLSEQLSQIANKASELTSDIKAKAGITETLSGTTEQPIFTSPAKNFTVGNLQCRSRDLIFLPL
jgi:hypothetical protein